MKALQGKVWVWRAVFSLITIYLPDHNIFFMMKFHNASLVISHFIVVISSSQVSKYKVNYQHSKLSNFFFTFSHVLVFKEIVKNQIWDFSECSVSIIIRFGGVLSQKKDKDKMSVYLSVCLWWKENYLVGRF